MKTTIEGLYLKPYDGPKRGEVYARVAAEHPELSGEKLLLKQKAAYMLGYRHNRGVNKIVWREYMKSYSIRMKAKYDWVAIIKLEKQLEAKRQARFEKTEFIPSTS